MFVVNGDVRSDHFGTSKTLDKNTYNPKEKHTYKITPDAIYCDGKQVYTQGVSSNTTPSTLYIGAVKTNGSVEKYSTVNLYSFKIYHGNTLVRDFVPHKDDNEKFCLKDAIENKFYYSNNALQGPVDLSHIKTGDILNFDYTGAVQAIALPKGIYKLECWGAQGGYSSSNSGIEVGMGGKGGYSVGTITLNQKTPIYIYAGGVGSISGNGKADGGFPNGGSSWASNTSEGAGGGGGSSDIRIGTDSLHARVIVAGGGGGGWYGACPAGGQTTPATSNSGDDTSGSPGGSGYVYTSSTAKNYPNGCLVNSTHYLTNAKTIAGNTSFPSPSGTSETGHSGNGYCRITVIECNSTALYAKVNNSLKKVTSIYFKMNNKIYGIGADNSSNTNMNFSYTGSVQTATLDPGKYILECWGAQGGYRSSSSYGGAGGYSIGTLSLSSKTTLYIYVGGSGNSVISANSSGYYPGGFNGGGYRNTYKGGGGATDIRIGTDSLYSRVIVAGGGGSDGSSSQSGGYAGGTSGARGSFGYGSYGYGGNQTATYSSLNAIASQGTNNNSSDCAAGFGFGGFECYSSSGYGGAGGGGWYGGQGTYPDGSGDDDGGGGGGSGYVYTSSTAKNYPQGCLLNSSYYLTDAQTIAGNQAFTSPEGTSETGHSGNGFCRITNMTPKQYGMFIKRNGAWTHINL